jgi:hypothetical protein
MSDKAITGNDELFGVLTIAPGYNRARSKKPKLPQPAPHNARGQPVNVK